MANSTKLKFEVPVKKAVGLRRVSYLAHTNPVFAIVGGKPCDVAGQRGMVLQRRESMLDPEVASHAAERVGGGEAGLRSRS